jgi:hypothetical protein
MCYVVNAINSTTRASNATPVHNSNGTIEGNVGKYMSLVSESSTLPLAISSVSPKVSPQITEIPTYALHDADLIDDEEKKIKFDDLLIDEGNTKMDIDGIFDDKENHPRETLGLQPLVHEHLNDA